MLSGKLGYDFLRHVTRICGALGEYHGLVAAHEGEVGLGHCILPHFKRNLIFEAEIQQYLPCFLSTLRWTDESRFVAGLLKFTASGLKDESSQMLFWQMCNSFLQTFLFVNKFTCRTRLKRGMRCTLPYSPFRCNGARTELRKPAKNISMKKNLFFLKKAILPNRCCPGDRCAAPLFAKCATNLWEWRQGRRST